MVVVFAHTAGVTGAEAGIAGGSRRARPEAPRGGLRRPGRPVARRAGPTRPRGQGDRPARRASAAATSTCSTASRSPRRRPRSCDPRHVASTTCASPRAGRAPRRHPEGAEAETRPGRIGWDPDPSCSRRGRTCRPCSRGPRSWSPGVLTSVHACKASSRPWTPRAVASTTRSSTTPRLSSTGPPAASSCRRSTPSSRWPVPPARASPRRSTRSTELELSAVGVRRPTTSWATACVWGRDGAEELLEWLGIPARHQVTRDSMLYRGPRGRRAPGRRAPRPARPRLDRGVPPPRGRPAGQARRHARVGPRPAEVRRRRHPRPLPRAAQRAPRRDDGRAQPHRHRARGPPRGHARRRTPPARGRRPRPASR